MGPKQSAPTNLFYYAMPTAYLSIDDPFYPIYQSRLLSTSFFRLSNHRLPIQPPLCSSGVYLSLYTLLAFPPPSLLRLSAQLATSFHTHYARVNVPRCSRTTSPPPPSAFSRKRLTTTAKQNNQTKIYQLIRNKYAYMWTNKRSPERDSARGSEWHTTRRQQPLVRHCTTGREQSLRKRH